MSTIKLFLRLNYLSSKEQPREKKEPRTKKKSKSKPWIVPMDALTPAFRNQEVITKTGIYNLDRKNSLILIKNFLPDDMVDEYLEKAQHADRKSGPTAFNAVKPRKEIIYTTKEKGIIYGGVKHDSVEYPKYVLKLVPYMLKAVKKFIPDNIYTKLSTGIDIIYDADFPRGGSVGKHSDSQDEGWGLIVIWSLGQTRWLRVRRIKDGEWYNVKMEHNSLTVMYGKTFQQLYTHQVDKLMPKDEVGSRLSLNVRFVPE